MSSDSSNRDLLSQLGDDARVLKQARVLPSGPLTEEHIAAVRADYMTYTAKRGVSDAQAAKEIGIAASTLSQWRSGQYAGDNEKVARAVNDWMETHARRDRAATPPGYVTTRVAEEMSAIVNAAITTGAMAAIVAPSGSGKTMVLRVLADKYRGRYIYCTEDLSAKTFLVTLADAVDATVPVYRNRNRYELLKAIVERLRGTNRPIILDEAHRLPAEVLPRIRSIYDQAGVPIILAGAAAILDTINDRSDGRGQFASRCIQYSVLDHVTNAEGPDPDSRGARGAGGRPLFSQDEVRTFLDGLQVRFDPDGFRLAWAIACLPNHGCLRTLLRVVSLLRPDAGNRDAEPITRPEVLTALALLFGQTGRYMGTLADRQRQAMEAA